MQQSSHASQEITIQPSGGWPVLWLCLGWIVVAIGLSLRLGTHAAQVGSRALVAALIAALILSVFFAVVLLFGLFIVNPNEARALLLFGRYRGSARVAGLFWVNPFTTKRRVSLKAHNFASKTVKVNDAIGNPIEIGAVVV